MSLQVGRFKGRGIANSKQYGKSSSGGDRVAIDLQFEDGTVATTTIEFAGGAQAYGIDRLWALGWDGSPEFNGLDRNEVDIEVAQVEYEGKPQWKVQILTRGSFSFKSPMNQQEIKAFGARIANAAKATTTATRAPYANGTGGTAKHTVQDAEFGNSEIPF